MPLLDSLPHRCKIQRKVWTAGTLGGVKTSVTVEQTGVECWEQQASSSEIDAYDKRGMSITNKVFFTSDPNVTENHQIVITEREGVTESDPLVLDVISEPRPDTSAGLGVVWRVMTNRLTGRDQ